MTVVRVGVDEKLRAHLLRRAVAVGNHLAEFPRRIDVEQRKGQSRWREGLLGKPQHDGTVFADRIKHHRVLELGDRFAQDVNALGLESPQMGQPTLVDIHVRRS
jgi:hypothetical protein